MLLASSAAAAFLKISTLALQAQSERRSKGSEPSQPSLDVPWPATLERAGAQLELFAAVATSGTPLDITLQELRIETFFAVNDASRAALAQLGGS